METENEPEEEKQTWAKPIDRLHTSDVPAEGINLNVEGRQLTGPIQGFGQMWQKTYRVMLEGTEVAPEELIAVWKKEFPTFWPKGNRFYAPLEEITPGEVAVLNMAGPRGITGPKGMPVFSTGIMVIYADDESFSFMTPEGHPMAGMITFSSHLEGEATVAQIQALVRASDPFWEFTFRLGMLKEEDRFWEKTLGAVAKRFGSQSKAQTTVVRVDPRVQWSQAKNIWHNAAIRTTFYYFLAPFRWVANFFRRKNRAPAEDA